MWRLLKLSKFTKEKNLPLMPHDIPDRPWEKVGVDIFTLNSQDYLLVVDYFSKFVEMIQLRNKTGSTVVSHLKATFARHGIPMIVISDNMPFNSEPCHRFAKEWDFQWQYTSLEMHVQMGWQKTHSNS